jgi:hypothetical protein
MAGNEPLLGAASLAKAVERRRFLRKAATSVFYGMVAVSAGSVSLATFLADPAEAAGACCPSCCGPSPCCETSCCSKNCCGSPRNRCVDNGSSCLGRYTADWPNAGGCWSCRVSATTVVHCCDCKINSTSGCGGGSKKVCICYGYERT